MKGLKKLKIGKQYVVNHSRKGMFVAEVLDVYREADDEWVDVRIVDGVAKMLANPDVKVNETLRIRACFATFREVVR